jgi:uncharacterized protein YecE (DUF72 family)
MTGQLGLFSEASVADLARTHEESRALAASLPPRLYFGTSSWAFPGWQGIVYSRQESPAALSRDGMREYATHPLLRTVEIDRSYYAPIPLEDFQRYATQLPEGFRCCIKAPGAVTSVVLPGRTPTPQPNPNFLSVELLEEELLTPLDAAFAGHAGPIVLQFPPHPYSFRMSARVFADRLSQFLSRLPKRFRFAVELRDADLLSAEYSDVLRHHAAAHAYNFWSNMPMPAEQEKIVPLSHAGFTVLRLMLPPGTSYDGQRENFRPFDRLHEPHVDMRRQVTEIARRSTRDGRDTFVIVNNKAEGSSPLTIRALAEMMVSEAP